MNQFFLKFEDKDEAVLSGLAIADVNDGEIIKQTKDYFIDVVGVIPSTVASGEFDDNGEVIYETFNIDGYHVNLLIDELPSSLLPFTINVDTPYRVFSGY